MIQLTKNISSEHFAVLLTALLTRICHRFPCQFLSLEERWNKTYDTKEYDVDIVPLCEYCAFIPRFATPPASEGAENIGF